MSDRNFKATPEQIEAIKARLAAERSVAKNKGKGKSSNRRSDAPVYVTDTGQMVEESPYSRNEQNRADAIATGATPGSLRVMVEAKIPTYPQMILRRTATQSVNGEEGYNDLTWAWQLHEYLVERWIGNRVYIGLTSKGAAYVQGGAWAA